MIYKPCLIFHMFWGLSLSLSAAAIHAAELKQEPVSFKPVGETRTGATLPNKVTASLLIPENATKPYPAVVIVHGSGGVDGRGAFYEKDSNEVGIATLEIWMFPVREQSPSRGEA